MRIFVQNQGMREILPQAYSQYSEDKILSITPRLGERTILQDAQQIIAARIPPVRQVWRPLSLVGWIKPGLAQNPPNFGECPL